MKKLKTNYHRLKNEYSDYVVLGSETSMPKVSFIIPAFNAEKTIRTCVESIIRSGVDCEIIIVNDGSQDNTALEVKNIKTDYDNVILINQINQGPNVARKNGFLNSKGEYIVFADSDDYYSSSVLSKAFERIKDKDIDITEYNYTTIIEDESVESSISNNALVNKEIIDYWFRAKHANNFLWNKIFRRDVLKNVEFPALFAGEDSCILLQAFTNAHSYESYEDSIYYYVQNTNGLCKSTPSLRTLDELKADHYKLDYISKTNAEYIPDVATAACGHIAICYDKIYYSSLEDKEKHMQMLISEFRKFRKHFRFTSKIFRGCSLKRKISILLFCLSPNLHANIHRC